MKNVIINGDCLEVLRKMGDNSIDSVVTDPPYGLSKEPDIEQVLSKWLAGESYHSDGRGFMNKSWDSFVPNPDVWKEVYRVLKPGGHALVFAGTRTQDLMTVSLRLGGFEIRDVMEWLYFSGFPKSMDVGKAFDRRRTEDLPHIYAVTKFIADGRNKAKKTNQEIDKHFGLNGVAGHWTTLSSQPRVPKIEQWLRLKEFLALSDEMDTEVWRLNDRKGEPGDAWDAREKIGEVETKDFSHHNGSMMSKEMTEDWSTKTITVDITAPATDIAQQWDGWGTALKPAHEPIIVARKPLSGTVANTVERCGTGAINIDGCRIGGETRESGRFPANCVTVEDNVYYSPYFNVTPHELCKKAGKKDRNSDWKGEGISRETVITDDGRKKAIDNPFLRGETKRINSHPTVKPTELMAWLVRLVTPPCGTILDPYVGSGTTLVAARREGFNSIGIEQSREYCEIATVRTGLPIIEASVVGVSSNRQVPDTAGEAAYA